MQRGDIIATIGRGDFSPKPRPALVVQSNLFNEDHPAVTVCPITSQVTGDNFFRVPVSSDGQTGLLQDSEVEIDRVQAIWRQRIGQRIGRAPEEVMFAVDAALRRWLEI